MPEKSPKSETRKSSGMNGCPAGSIQWFSRDLEYGADANYESLPAHKRKKNVEHYCTALLATLTVDWVISCFIWGPDPLAPGKFNLTVCIELADPVSQSAPPPAPSQPPPSM